MPNRTTLLLTTATALCVASVAAAQHAPARVHDTKAQAARQANLVAAATPQQAAKPQETDSKVLTIGSKAPEPALSKIFQGRYRLQELQARQHLRHGILGYLVRPMQSRHATPHQATEELCR